MASKSNPKSKSSSGSHEARLERSTKDSLGPLYPDGGASLKGELRPGQCRGSGKGGQLPSAAGVNHLERVDMAPGRQITKPIDTSKTHAKSDESLEWLRTSRQIAPSKERNPTSWADVRRTAGSHWPIGAPWPTADAPWETGAPRATAAASRITAAAPRTIAAAPRDTATDPKSLAAFPPLGAGKGSAGHSA